jgi:hypothetical protein
MKEECAECFLIEDIGRLEQEIEKKEELIEYYISILSEIATLPNSPFHKHYTLKEKIDRMQLIAEKAQKGKW